MPAASRLPDRILALLQGKKATPLDAPALSRRLRVPPAALSRTLTALEKEGRVARVRHDHWISAGSADLVTGTIQFHPRGFAFVTPAEGEGPDLRIDAEDTGTALHGDLVVARLQRPSFPGRRRRDEEEKPRGRVLRILERRNANIVGTLQKTARFFIVIPDDPRLQHNLYVPEPGTAGSPAAAPGDKVVARLTEWKNRHTNPEGVVVERLGHREDPGVDILSIVRKFDLPTEFPAQAIAEASSFPAVELPDQPADREDLRGDFVITIDPDTARDFDDAISLRELPGGHAEIGIHIADVSHYVKPGSPLDVEARERGNSTYLVGTVIPMLPHALSSGLCSLVEAEDRLVKTVLCEFTPDARLVRTEFANSVIRSVKRLTYKQAYAFLQHLTKDQIRALPAPPPHQTGSPGRPLAELTDAELDLVQGMVDDLWNIAKVLRAERFRAGSLDLEMKEIKIYCDKDGWADRTEVVQHDESHQLIEEFMLMANECVAKSLDQTSVPHVSRVHDEPDPEKLGALREELAANGFKVGDLTHRTEMVKLLASLKDREDGYTIRIQLLRSLKQACYRPSPDGHFGLAKRHYSHFTSPIRRYSDLPVHRALDLLAAGRKAPLDGLHKLGEECSQLERRAESAERELVKLKLLLYLSGRIGAEMEGVVTGVEPFGLFVQGIDLPAEGLVALESLPDDTYRYERSSHVLTGRRAGNTFRLGDRVRVEVARVDLDRRMLELRLVERARRGSAARAAKKPRQAPKKHAPKQSPRGRKRSRRR